MYKVMLVDDERLILQGILNIIEWDKLGLEVVHLAETGLEALNKFKLEPVDIVITDINMPSLTGLELLKSIKELNKKVRFIILSGYDDFSYAKTAIHYGVENYILKPINEEELENALLEIKNKIDEDKKKENNLFDKNRILMKFLEGNINEKDLKRFEDIININFKDKYYIASNILINNKEWKQVDEIINVIKKQTNEGYELIFKFNGDVILLNSWNTEETKEDIIKYYECIKDGLKDAIKEDIFIAIGDIVDEIEKIKESYDSSNSIKKYVLTNGYGVCVSKDDIIELKEESRSFSKEIENLHKVILEKDMKKIEEYIAKTFDDKSLNPKNIYDLSIKVLLLIDEVSEEFKYNKNYVRDNLSNVIIKLCNESGRENIKKFLISSIGELTKVMNSNNVKYSPIVQQIVNHVNEKYCEELSLKTLSQQYNINSSYLGQIFNKEMGYSFSEYLNKVKNMKAKELILNTNMRINDIAKEVGYFDTSYFYRKFKKYYGVSPSTLREIKQY